MSEDKFDAKLTLDTACLSCLLTSVTTPPEGFFTFYEDSCEMSSQIAPHPL